MRAIRADDAGLRAFSDDEPLAGGRPYGLGEAVVAIPVGLRDVRDLLRRAVGELFDVDVAILDVGDLAEGAGRVIEAAEREQERRLARQVVDETLAGGRGALGLQDTLRMLRESRVHELVISENVLHTAEGEAAASMAEDSGIDIEVIHDEAEEALSPHGGIGAVLRY